MEDLSCPSRLSLTFRMTEKSVSRQKDTKGLHALKTLNSSKTYLARKFQCNCAPRFTSVAKKQSKDIFRFADNQGDWTWITFLDKVAYCNWRRHAGRGSRALEPTALELGDSDWLRGKKHLVDRSTSVLKTVTQRPGNSWARMRCRFPWHPWHWFLKDSIHFVEENL